MKSVILLGALGLCTACSSEGAGTAGTTQATAGAGGSQSNGGGAGSSGTAGVSGGSAGSNGDSGGAGTSSATDASFDAPRLDASVFDDAGPACDAGSTDWGNAVVDSTNKRFPTPAQLGAWSYQPALFLHGEYLVYKRTHDARYLAYIKDWVDSHVDANGNTNPATFDSLDNMMPGNLFLDLYQETNDARYKTAAGKIRQRYDTYPRTTDRSFFHKIDLIGQTWGDGVFMGLPFLGRYGHLFADATYADNETTDQLLKYHDHLKHPTNGVHYHAWDEQGDATWTDPATKHSPESWCRAVGWYGMATIEVLEVLPVDHPSRPQVISILKGLIDGFKGLQDPATGRWFQVIDRGSDPNDWLETSCSSMLTYTVSRAVQRGYVPTGYSDIATKGYQGVLQKISLGADGLTNIADICIGTGVGDYAFYLARPRATNDFHGLGAFLIMYEQLAPRCR